MEIRYVDSIEGISPDMLNGFFEGWPKKPSPEKHLRILKNSTFVFLAFDEDEKRVAGFINALSDGVLSVYLPLLEVLPKYRKLGIGGQLMRRMLDRVKNYYMIDLLCDEELRFWYKSFGLNPAYGMCIRNYDRQSGD